MQGDTRDAAIGTTSSLRRQHGTIRAVAVAAAFALVSAGCGGSSGPPVAGGATTNSATGNGGTHHASALVYSRCMRSHGEPNFPDPNSSGQINIASIAADKNSPGFRTAQNDCKSLLPVGTAAEQTQLYSQLLNFSKCMRAHGIANFPDPQKNDNGVVTEFAGGDTHNRYGIDPNSPQYRRAGQACRYNLRARQGGAG